MLILFATPLAVFAAYSFLSGTLFQVSRPWTLENYREALNSNLNHVLAKNSLVVGLLSASVTLAVGLPIAYWLRYAAGRWRTLVLFLITATLFASYLVRIYAWRSILGQSGLLNSGFSGSGSSTTRLASCSKQVLRHGRARAHLPAVRCARSLRGICAARASPPRIGTGSRGERLSSLAVGWLPLIAAPAASAFLFVFVLSAGDYVTPQLIGGTNGVLLGVEVQAQFKAVGDFPLGAATSLLMLAAFVVCYALMALALRVTRLDRIRWSN